VPDEIEAGSARRVEIGDNECGTGVSSTDRFFEAPVCMHLAVLVDKEAMNGLANDWVVLAVYDGVDGSHRGSVWTLKLLGEPQFPYRCAAEVRDPIRAVEVVTGCLVDGDGACVQFVHEQKRFAAAGSS
jgi:hypothetical protein